MSAADCKASEVSEFTVDFLEKALEPAGWRAVWRTSVFKALVEVSAALRAGSPAGSAAPPSAAAAPSA